MNYFKEVANSWLESRKEEIKKSSYDKYENIINNYLFPQFKDYKINDITNEEIKYFVKKQNCNYGLNTVKSMFNTLKLILKFVEQKDVITWRNIGIKRNKNELDVLTIKECKLFNRALIVNTTNKDIGILLALNVGVRIGEICGLRWKDINLNKGSININHTMQRVKNNDKNTSKTKVILLEPKSLSSKREIPIPDFIFEIIKLKESESNSDASFLLTGEDDKYIEPRNLERYF